MIGPLARIIARYISGLMVSYGVMTQGDAAGLMPDLVLIAGAMIGFATEVAYAYAKRKGLVT
jgi:hypothetical protein